MAQEIDATKITSVTLEGACPDCFGQEQVWVKAERHESGNTYLCHNRCGWRTVREDNGEDYVAARVGEGYIYYTKETNLIAPWDIRPGMEKVLYNPK